MNEKESLNFIHCMIQFMNFRNYKFIEMGYKLEVFRSSVGGGKTGKWMRLLNGNMRNSPGDRNVLYHECVSVTLAMVLHHTSRCYNQEILG